MGLSATNPMKAASPAGQARAGLFAAGIILGVVDLAMLCASGGSFFKPDLGVWYVLKEHEHFVLLPEDVSDPDGVWVGTSVKDDEITVRVDLSKDAVGRNTLLMGKTQMGNWPPYLLDGTSTVILVPSPDEAMCSSALTMAARSRITVNP